MAFFGGQTPFDPIIFQDNPVFTSQFDLNPAPAPQQSKGGFGTFLRSLAGYWGDALTGNPVYANQQAQRDQQQQMDQWYERKRQDSLTDYEKQKEIDAKYSAPDLAGDIKAFQQAQQFGYLPQNASFEDFLKLMHPGQFVPPAPVNVPYGATIEGGDVPGATATNPKTGEKVRFNPSTGQWEPIGGQSGASSTGGFL